MRKKFRISSCLLGTFGLAALVVAAGCSSDVIAERSAQPLEGELKLRVADYADGKAEKFYGLVTDDGRFVRLEFLRAPRAVQGVRVRVSGELESGIFRVETLDVVADRAATRQTAGRHAGGPPMTLKTAFLSLDQSFSAATARSRLLEDSDSPRQFYLDNSFESWSIEGDGFGPYSVSTGGCDYAAIATDAKAAADAAGVMTSTYDNLMYYLPSSSGCDWAGLGEVGEVPARRYLNGRDTWYAGTDDCVVLAQELGHNYGMLHSHFCSSPPYMSYDMVRMDDDMTNCGGFSEYGDPFTPMASGCGHLNAYEMGLMNFVENCNTATVKSTGEYDMNPIETKTDGYQILRVYNKIVKLDPQYIYLEYRNGTAMSDSVSPAAIYIHAGADYVIHDRPPRPDNGFDLVDPFLLSPTGQAGSAYLQEGDEWQEPETQATFKVVSLGATAKVSITLANSTGEEPECYIDGAGGSGGMGGGGGAGGAGAGGASGAGGSAGTAGTSGAGGVAGTSGSGGSTGGAAGSAGTAGAGGSAGGGAGGKGGSAGTAGGAGMGGGSAGVGASSGSGAAGSGGSSDSGDDSGCGCQLPTSGRASSLAWLGVIGLVLGARRRRR